MEELLGKSIISAEDADREAAKKIFEILMETNIEKASHSIECEVP